MQIDTEEVVGSNPIVNRNQICAAGVLLVRPIIESSDVESFESLPLSCVKDSNGVTHHSDLSHVPIALSGRPAPKRRLRKPRFRLKST